MTCTFPVLSTGLKYEDAPPSRPFTENVMTNSEFPVQRIRTLELQLTSKTLEPCPSFLVPPVTRDRFYGHNLTTPARSASPHANEVRCAGQAIRRIDFALDIEVILFGRAHEPSKDNDE